MACPGVIGLLVVGMTVAVAIAAGVLAARARRRAAVADTLVERLRDEVWELKETAAARDRAEAASEAKSRFLATVSHEIRTPLSGIVGLADLLAHGRLDGEQLAYVDSIKTCGAALGSLIDEILDFSKIEAGKIDLAHEPIALASLVEGVVELLAPRAHGKGLEIAGYVAPDVPAEIMGDEARLRQVLMNLAGNAVKFTEAGGVGVSVVRDAESGIAFRVRDTGIGVPRERQAAIFAEFEQGDTSTTRRHGGTGLGLAICQRLVAHMKGAIGLESEPGRGSVFWFSIPLAAAPAKAVTAAKPSLHGKSALIVAASIFEAPYIGALLSQAGAEVSYADDAAAANEHFVAGPGPDLVIVDCGLGEEAVRSVAAATRAATVARSLVLFSPFERRAFGQDSIEGFGGWLVKPVRAGSLFARLTDAPSSPYRRRPPAKPAADPAPALKPGLRVLFAEDDDINALIVRSFLARLGADATHASDGAVAWSLAQDAIAGACAPFDAIVMDINMPRLDGREVARRIRRAEAAAHVARTRLVALTANAFPEDQRACLDAGFDTFLTKPVDIDDLAKALDTPARTAATGSRLPPADSTRREAPDERVYDERVYHLSSAAPTFETCSPHHQAHRP